MSEPTNITQLWTWPERKAVGDAHEERVKVELEQRGWTVARWGQGILPEQITWALRRSSTNIRWTPDLIAARDHEVCLIDCKARMSPHTKRHSVSQKAQRAHLGHLAWANLPIYYVFDDLGVLTPYEVANLSPFALAGSYYLIPPGQTHQFNDVFGDPWAWASQLQLAAA